MRERERHDKKKGGNIFLMEAKYTFIFIGKWGEKEIKFHKKEFLIGDRKFLFLEKVLHFAPGIHLNLWWYTTDDSKALSLHIASKRFETWKKGLK